MRLHPYTPTFLLSRTVATEFHRHLELREMGPFSKNSGGPAWSVQRRTPLNRNRGNRSISNQPEVGAESVVQFRSTHIASEPRSPPESMPSAEITSYKPTRRELFRQRRLGAATSTWPFWT